MLTKTEQLLALTTPYNNPYQGSDNRALFVCSAGLLRSATAANLYAKKGWNTRCAGSKEYALVPLSTNLVAWAQEIYFVNEENYLDALDTFLGTAFYTKIEAAHVLNVPDVYDYNDPRLVKLIEDQVEMLKSKEN